MPPPAKVIRTQAEFDALKGVIASPVALAAAFTLSSQLKVSSVLRTHQDAKGGLKWTGPIKAGETMMLQLRDNGRVESIAFDCGGSTAAGGAGCVDLRGSNTAVFDCTATGNPRDFVKVTGADNVQIVGNTVPSLWGYFLFTGPLPDGRVSNLKCLRNVCKESKGESVTRFHDMVGLEYAFNDFARPAQYVVVDEKTGRKDWVQKSILKGHDGADWNIHDNTFSGGNKGTQAGHSGVITLYPMGGRDGGIEEKDAKKKAAKLAYRLVDVKFHHNRCDDVVIHTGPGLVNVSIEQNTLLKVRDIAFLYRATENGFDYRAYRPEPTGIIRNNRVTKAAGNTKAVSNQPVGVKVSA